MSGGRIIGIIDLCASMALALFIPLIFARADQVAADAGKNVDSGALLQPFALLFVLPAAMLFAVAGAGMLLKWRFRRALQWLWHAVASPSTAILSYGLGLGVIWPNYSVKGNSQNFVLSVPLSQALNSK
jgi:hypothetical protein